MCSSFKRKDRSIHSGQWRVYNKGSIETEYKIREGTFVDISTSFIESIIIDWSFFNPFLLGPLEHNYYTKWRRLPQKQRRRL
jgi:hypothetical protein